MKFTKAGVRSTARVAGRGAALLTTSITLSVLTCPASFSQQAGPSEPQQGLQEIIVTAQKRSESLQAVPLSVVAIDAEKLKEMGITNISNLMGGQVPAVRVEPFAGNPSVLEIAIRGSINNNGLDVTNENPVPIYIDDVYYGRQNSLALELNELQRLEILRGPQGTLFGKNAVGGALRVVTKDPSGVLGLTQEVDGGNYGYYKSTTHLDLPSVGDFAAKLNFLATDKKGWTKNPAPGQKDYGLERALAAGAEVLWTPASNVRVVYAFDWTQLKTTETFNQQLSNTDPYGIWPDQSDKLASSVPYPTYRPLDNQKYSGHRITASWNVTDSTTLKSITAYRQDQADLYNTAQSASSLPYFFLIRAVPPAQIPGLIADTYVTGVIPLYVQKHSQFSEELQLTGNTDTVQWVTGLFFLHENAGQQERTYYGTAFPNAVLGAGGIPGIGGAPVSLGDGLALTPPNLIGPVSDLGADVINHSYAAFGQATWRPASTQWAFTGGLRVGRDEKEAFRSSGGVWDTVPYDIIPGDPASAPPPSRVCTAAAHCDTKYSKTRVLPVAVASYNFTRDLSSYARFSTGYQAPSLSVGGQLFKFDKPVTVNSYELGLKSEFWDHRARVNVAMFYSTTKDAHESLQTTSSSTVEYFNGPTIKTSGVELDSTFEPVDRLVITLALNYLNASQAPSPNPYPPPAGQGSTVELNQKVETPKWSGSLGFFYDIAHFDIGTLRANADIDSTAKYYSNPQTVIANTPRTLVNGRLALADIGLGAAGKLEIAAWVRNLTDKRYTTFIYQAPGVIGTGNFATFGDPRTYGGSVILKF